MKIKEICEYGKKSKIKAGEGLSEGNVKFFTSSSESNKYVNEEQFNSPGIIMGTGGNATLHYCDEPFSVSTDCIVLFPKIKISTKYLYYFFMGNFHVLQSGFKGAGLKHTSKKYIDEISLNHIPINHEQLQIVNILDNVNDLIFKKQKQLQEYDQLIKSRFVEMFGDQNKNPFKWNEKTIGETCKLKSGNSLPLSFENEGGPIPYIKVGDMNLSGNEKYITSSSRYVTVKTAGKGIFDIGTIIFPKRGGAIGTNKKRMTILPICADLNVMGVTPLEKLNSHYLLAYFDEVDMGSLNNGSSVPQINNIDIAPLKICLPPMELQNQFADFVQRVDKLKF